MKTISLLRILINLFFVFFLLLIAINIWDAINYLLLEPESLNDLWMMEAYGDTENSSSLVKLYLSFELIPYLPFALGILFVRNTIGAFVRKEYFSKEVTDNFRRSGSLFLITSVLILVKQAFGMMLIGRPTINVTIGHHYNYAFLIIIGLLFIFFGHVFSRARMLKQENELTI